MLTPNERFAAQQAAVLPFASLDDLPESTQDQIAALDKNLPVVVVMYYGGTIGMTQDKRGRLVATDDAEALLEPLAIKGLKKKVQVVWFPTHPKAIDSTNGRWVHWVSIGNAIRLLYDRIDGFVVCGGTDTMAYISGAMQFMFPNIGKPVIGAGSQMPMFELGDDATSNLFYSIAAAASDLSGGHLAFGDELMHGLHVHKIQDKRFRAFAAPTQHYIGHFEDGKVRLYPSAPRRDTIVTGARLKYNPFFREGIKVVRISPATPSESILHDATDPVCEALLLITFGAGNVRDEGIIADEQTHIDCLRQLYDRKYPIVLGSPMMDGRVDSPYRGGVLAVSTEEDGGGAISGGDTTGPTLEVKCMVALYHTYSDGDTFDYDKFRAEMERDHVGELTSEDER